MSNSLDYIKERISSGSTTFSGLDMNKAFVVPLTRFLKLVENEPYSRLCTVNVTGEKFTVNLLYNPNADFEYFTSSVTTHDGTLLFMYGTIEDCINNIMQLKTYDVRKLAPDQIKLDRCEITYTIGDIVVVNETDEKFAPADKKWMQDRTIVMIPLIYEYKERC